MSHTHTSGMSLRRHTDPRPHPYVPSPAGPEESDTVQQQHTTSKQAAIKQEAEFNTSDQVQKHVQHTLASSIHEHAYVKNISSPMPVSRGRAQRSPRLLLLLCINPPPSAPPSAPPPPPPISPLLLLLHSLSSPTSFFLHSRIPSLKKHRPSL